MTSDVFSAQPGTPVSALVRQVSEKGLPHIPVVNSRREVVGIVTQSDMLALFTSGLHYRKLEAFAYFLTELE